MSTLTFVFTAILAALTMILGSFWSLHRRKLRREMRDFEEASREMRAEFEMQLVAVAPEIYNRPSRVLPSVEQYQDGTRFWQRRNRVLLTIRLTAARDHSTVLAMSREYVQAYLARPVNRNCRVRVNFPPNMEGKGNGGEAR